MSPLLQTEPTTAGNIREVVGIPTASHPRSPALQRPRIAILSTWHPEPADNGRKQRTRQIISALSDDYDIVLISLLSREMIDGELIAPVPGVWQQWVFPLPVYHPRSVSAVLGSVSRYPRSLVSTWDRKTAESIRSVIRETEAILAIGTDMRTLRYLSVLECIQTILDEPDVSPFVVGNQLNGSILERLRIRLRERKYRYVLKTEGSQLDAVFVASHEEAEAFSALSDTPSVTVIENGVSRVAPSPWRAPQTDQLLYTGSITYGANAEAIRYFANAILPQITIERPGTILTVTGALPSTTPTDINHPNVRLAGRIADLEPIYRESKVFVAPILSGTGTRIKILEALAIGMPVVSTTKGVEGLDVVDGEHLLIADDSQVFAQAILSLMHDPMLAESIGSRGRSLVERRYDWRNHATQLRQYVAELLVKDR